MNSDHPPKKPTTAPISATDFPALRSFLRGYFHQDMKEEYGSPEEAVREFCEDASTQERAQVAREWAKFLDRTNGQPMEEVNRLLTGPLGSSCSVTYEETRGITAALSRTTQSRNNRALDDEDVT
jgi:hypothetical protein